MPALFRASSACVFIYHNGKMHLHSLSRCRSFKQGNAKGGRLDHSHTAGRPVHSDTLSNFTQWCDGCSAWQCTYSRVSCYISCWYGRAPPFVSDMATTLVSLCSSQLLSRPSSHFSQPEKHIMSCNLYHGFSEGATCGLYSWPDPFWTFSP